MQKLAMLSMLAALLLACLTPPPLAAQASPMPMVAMITQRVTLSMWGA